MKAQAIVILLTLVILGTVEGFAAWLKCYVDLFDDSEVIMNNLIINSDDAKQTVTIEVQPQNGDTKSWADDLTYDGAMVVNAKLLVPDELGGDVQYVMEVVSGDAAFVSPVMCDGKRAHATGRGQSVTLRIEGSSEYVDLVAGYATGHEAVTLTKTLRLTRTIASTEL